MNLEKNIFDTVKEWELKIGYRREDIRLYYPEESLLELLGTETMGLQEEIDRFCHKMYKNLGRVEIEETEEKGRYCIKVSSEVVEYIHRNIPENVFLKTLLTVVTTPGKKLEDALAVFKKFSGDVEIEKIKEHEWAVSFTDPGIDPYVYYMEEDDFGLEYHRFTKEAYSRLSEAI